MAVDGTKRGLPPGLLSGLLFFAVVLAGSGYIVFSKLHEFSAFTVTAVPVLIMIGYALLLGIARLFRLRDDQSGDNLYYMGFLFTLTSLAVSRAQPPRLSRISVLPSLRPLRALPFVSCSTRCAATPLRLKLQRGWN